MGDLYTHRGGEWPSEPTTIDNSWSKYGEPLVSWLERSTLPQAQAARQFLRRNLAAIPSEYRDDFIQALRTRWDSAFLEFILARTIQVLGGKFSLEQQNSDGRCPDFCVSFGDRKLVIEVVSPVFDKEVDDERTRDAPLLEFMNTKVPEPWSINVIQLPNIGPEDSKKEFKKAFLQVRDELPVNPQERWYKITKKLGLGQLKLEFFPKKLGHEPIVYGAMYCFLGDAEERIRQAVKKKRKQVRAEAMPVLLAVHASGWGVKFDHFDRALFGHVFTIGGNSLEKTQFKRDGLFLESGKEGKSPTYAGVIAFKRIDIIRKSAPVIYYHPRFNGELPVQLMNFEQRRFRYPDEISIQVPKSQNILAELGFIPDHL